MKFFILLITISITLAAVIKHPDDNNDEMKSPKVLLEFKDVGIVETEDSLLPGIIDKNRVKRGFWDSFVGGINDVANSIPGVGHVKGAIHLAAGDQEGAQRAMIEASRGALLLSAGAAGTFAGGPAGGAAAAVAAGTAFDGALHAGTDGKEPRGIFKKIGEMNDDGVTAGRIFETAFVPAKDGVGSLLPG